MTEFVGIVFIVFGVGILIGLSYYLKSTSDKFFFVLNGVVGPVLMSTGSPLLVCLGLLNSAAALLMILKESSEEN